MLRRLCILGVGAALGVSVGALAQGCCGQGWVGDPLPIELGTYVVRPDATPPEYTDAVLDVGAEEVALEYTGADGERYRARFARVR